MASRLPVPSGTAKAVCLCILCAQTSSTALAKRLPLTASSVSKCGFTKVTTWAVMRQLLCKNRAMMRSAVHAHRVATVIVQHLALRVLVAPILHQLMAATSLLKLLMQPLQLPLSACVKQPRQPHLLTVKEKNHATTRPPQIPQRAKRS